VSSAAAAAASLERERSVALRLAQVENKLNGMDAAAKQWAFLANNL
jgi:hypothetical protein